ncbi:MAG: M16 family metallopeptidase [Planctomycetota bacterium]
MMRFGTMFSIGLLWTLGTTGFASDLPAHPREIQFPELRFDAPEPGQHRHVLSNGVVVYLARTMELPLINFQLRFQGAGYLDPVGKEGLTAAMASMLRRGGTLTVTAQAMDERFDFLAAEAGVRAAQFSVGASLNTIAQNLDDSFALFMDMLRNPGFQKDRFDIYRDEVIESMKQRNDDADSIIDREWDALLYGREHFEGRVTTQKSLQAITVDDLRAMHARVVQPGGLIVGVTGAFEPAAMLERLERAFAGWTVQPRVPDPPAPEKVLEAGVYHVEKDIPQGKVYIGHRSVKLDDPDQLELAVMDRILGAGGFTSRIMRKVRSDEGLAYTAGARTNPGEYYPGQFRALFQSKSSTVALATKLILGEMERIRTEPVSTEELETAKNSMVEAFPSIFGSKAQTVDRFITEEARGRSWDYWRTFRDRVRAIDVADIQRVAAEHLHPDKVAIMVVGKWEDIGPGDIDGRARMAEFFGGKVTHLPLRDPLTQEPIRDVN